MKYFSAHELRDIAVSLAVLCIIFSYPDFLSNAFFLLVSFIAVGIAFIGHELAHKFAAMRHGFWAEYRMWPQGLVLALLFAFASGGTFFFAAPGAVYFAGSPFRRIGKRQLRLIGMAGICFNIVMLWSTLLIGALTGNGLFLYMATINGWLAIFNLIPIGGLDGQKLLSLDRVTWAALLVLAVAGFLMRLLF